MGGLVPMAASQDTVASVPVTTQLRDTGEPSVTLDGPDTLALGAVGTRQ